MAAASRGFGFIKRSVSAAYNALIKRKNDQDEDIRDAYDLGNIVGSGSFGQVRLATLKSDPTITRAVKIVERDDLEEGELNQQGKVASVFREVKVLGEIKHPHIIEFFEFYEDAEFMYVVMEYCNGGELFDKLLTLKRFSNKDASVLARQMVSSIAYLHQKGFVHRDIKAENFIFASSDNYMENGLKMIDFGMTVGVPEGDEYLVNLCGSPHYLAPEIIGQKYQEGVDIWSFGVLLYLLLYGFYPFDAGQTTQLLLKILTEEIKYNHPQKPSDAAIKAISGCLQRIPKKRLTAKQALQEPWIKGEGAEDVEVGKGVLQSARRLSNAHARQAGQQQQQREMSTRLQRLSVLHQKGESVGVKIDPSKNNLEAEKELAMQRIRDKQQRKHSTFSTLMGGGQAKKSPSSIVPVEKSTSKESGAVKQRRKLSNFTYTLGGNDQLGENDLVDLTQQMIPVIIEEGDEEEERGRKSNRVSAKSTDKSPESGEKKKTDRNSSSGKSEKEKTKNSCS